MKSRDVHPIEHLLLIHSRYRRPIYSPSSWLPGRSHRSGPFARPSASASRAQQIRAYLAAITES